MEVDMRKPASEGRESGGRERVGYCDGADLGESGHIDAGRPPGRSRVGYV